MSVGSTLSLLDSTIPLIFLSSILLASVIIITKRITLCILNNHLVGGVVIVLSTQADLWKADDRAVSCFNVWYSFETTRELSIRRLVRVLTNLPGRLFMDLTMLMNLTWLCECVWALHSSFSSHLKQLPASFSKEPCFLLGLYEPVCIRYFFLEFFFFFFNRQLFLPKKNFAYCHGNGLRILYFFSSFPMDCSYIPLFSLHLPDLLKFLPTYNISPYKFLLLSPTLKF